MRIITGTLKGRRFNAPKDTVVRPTSDRAKEGLFNVIEARRYIEGTRVLDLFAGSGNLGFEAISRGAASVLAIEYSRAAVQHIAETAAGFGIEGQIEARAMPVERFLEQPPQSFDIIFADPPYELEGIPEMADKIVYGGWLALGGWLVLEHDVRHLFHEHPDCVFTKPYGRTIVSIFMPPAEESESIPVSETSHE